MKNLKFNYLLILFFFITRNYSSSLSAQEVPEIASLLSQYISIPSQSGNENAAGEFLSKTCLKKDLEVTVLTDSIGQYNFTASLYPLSSGKPNIVLMNHIDVVTPGDESRWIYPPDKGVISDGCVWGRGAIDNKGMAVMQLQAMASLVELSKTIDLPYNVTMLSLSSEELGGGKGAAIVSKRFMNVLNPVVMLGEGGSGIRGVVTSRKKVIYGVSVAHKRGLWLKLVLSIPVPGHASVPSKKCANKVMIKALHRLNKKKSPLLLTKCTRQMFHELGGSESGAKGYLLRNIEKYKMFMGPIIRNKPILSSLMTNTVTITNIRNPNASVNSIPQTIEVILDCRLLPETNSHEFIEDIRQTLNEDSITIEILNETRPASPSYPDKYFREIEFALNSVYDEISVVPILFPAFNDNHYFREKGIPVFGILPIELNDQLLQSIHNCDERIPVESLIKGQLVYEKFLSNLVNPPLLTNRIEN